MVSLFWRLKQDSMFLSFFYFLPILYRCLAVSALGQKHCRIARLERFALLCVSSCSPHPFIVHRTRGVGSQLTAADVAVKSGVTD